MAWRGLLTESASFYQVKISSLLALNAGHRAIGKSLVGRSIQRHPNRKAAGHIIPNDLNAANSLPPKEVRNYPLLDNRLVQWFKK
jgi:hypothetical protein